MSFFEFLPGCQAHEKITDVVTGLGVREDPDCWFTEQQAVNAAFQLGGSTAAREALSELGARTEEIPDFFSGEGPWKR